MPRASARHYRPAARFIRVSEKPNLLKRIKVIWVVQSCLQKYSASHLTQITSRTPAVPLLTRGVSRSSRTLGRDAVDVSGATDESADLRTAKSCGPDAPTLASSWRR